MAKKAGRPTWFKIFLHEKSVIDAVPDDIAGKALKAALQYFDTGELPVLDPLTNTVFSAMRPYIDESFDDYQRSSAAGRAGNEARWGKRESGGDTL